MKRHLLLLGILTFIFSCSDDAQPFVIYDVETDYRIQMKEYLSEEKQELAFEISTLTGFDCEDAEIITQSSIIDGEINIEIKEIRLPAGCGEGQNFARTALNLGELNEGIFNITLSIGETIFNYGTVTNTEDKYQLEFNDDLNGMEISHLVLNKIPAGTIWGRIKYNDSNAVSIVSDLKILLDEFGALSATLPTGKYTNFETAEGNIWSWDEESTFLYESSLAYSYTGDNIILLGAALDSFNNEFGAVYDFDLDIYTYTGLEY